MTIKSIFWPFTSAISHKNNTSVFGNFSIYLLSLFFLGLFLIVFNQDSSLRKTNLNLDEKLPQQKISDSFYLNLTKPYKNISYKIESNDSLNKILNEHSINKNEVGTVIKMLKREKLTNIYSGRELKMLLKSYDDNTNEIVFLNYPIDNITSIEVTKKNKKFNIVKKILKLEKNDAIVSGQIKDSLYKSAIKNGLEPNIIVEFARIFGFEIDFQRDIRKGDGYEILYEKFLDERKIVRDTGKILFASMKLHNRQINLYYFKFEDEEGYYDISGKSIVKSLMKTPINGARLSSSFGMRKHPILGFNKMHRGTDFAAPKGTPIMASGSGTITRARWCGGGGNCVKIKHNSTYETIYAHMSKFAKGIKEGRKVKQGQIIGYVGSTGMSTGPHLHYEVVVNGKKVNSQKLKLPSGKILKGIERNEFEISRIKMDLKLAELKSN